MKKCKPCKPPLTHTGCETLTPMYKNKLDRSFVMVGRQQGIHTNTVYPHSRQVTIVNRHSAQVAASKCAVVQIAILKANGALPEIRKAGTRLHEGQKIHLAGLRRICAEG
jgi:hypothetical protein